jgi:hypothetical protein
MVSEERTPALFTCKKAPEASVLLAAIAVQRVMEEWRGMVMLAQESTCNDRKNDVSPLFL